jgi:MFS family permease
MSNSVRPGDSSTTAGPKPLSVTFIAAACALVLVFAAAGVPIPLYNVYRAEDNITNGDLALVSVGYFVAAATSLLVLGRLSDYLGRRPVALASLTSAALGTLILTGTHTVIPLLAGRILQGLACGIASSSLGSYVVDTAPKGRSWLPAAITSSAPMLGVPLGALMSGALVEFGPAPRILAYVVIAALLGLLAVIVASGPETRPRAPGALASLRPKVQIAAGSGRLVAAAGASSVATWSLGGFYQAFGPSFTAEHLGTVNALASAAVFSSVMILNPLGGRLASGLSPATSLRAGMVVFILALIAILTTLRLGWIAPLIGASLVVGIAQGAAATGAMQALLSEAKGDERAGILSTFFLISYCGAAIPGIIAGRLVGALACIKLRWDTGCWASQVLSLLSCALATPLRALIDF